MHEAFLMVRLLAGSAPNTGFEHAVQVLQPHRGAEVPIPEPALKP